MIGPSQFKRIIVTGGAGFIGSEVCRKFVNTGYHICNIDKLTYASNPESLYRIANQANYRFECADICNTHEMSRIIDDFQPDAILHLAAESHVDRSIESPAIFIQTNVAGTVSMLEAALQYWRRRDLNKPFRFHHVSTDEVFGELQLDNSLFTEDTPYCPSSPYSASKAASDFMVQSWHRTYALPYVLSNCSNNYGPYQNTEKLIPRMIHMALAGAPLPVYGRGENIRDWLHVSDHVHALECILNRGRNAQRYNIGGHNEWRNIDVVKLICRHLDRKSPRADGQSYEAQISYVTDRPGHDLRYAIDGTKITAELGWKPYYTFVRGLGETVDWYLANRKFRPVDTL